MNIKMSVNRGFYTTKKEIIVRGQLDKYDSLTCFGIGFLLCQVVGALVLLVTSDIGSAAALQLTLVAFSLMYAKRNGIGFEELKIKKVKLLNVIFSAILGFSMLFVTLPLVNAWVTMFENWGIGTGGASFSYGTTLFENIIVVVVVGLLPAFGEELLFRGAIANGFANSYGQVKAIVFSALLFTLMHANLTQFLHPLIIGCVMAFVMFKTGSIIPAMIIHAVNNTTSVVIDITMGEEFSVFYEEYMWLFFVVGGVVSVATIIGFIVYNKNKLTTKKDVDAEESVNVGSDIELTYNQQQLAQACIMQERKRKSIAWGSFAAAGVLCVASLLLVMFA